MSTISRREMLRYGASMIGGGALLGVFPHCAKAQTPSVNGVINSTPAGISAFTPGFTNADSSLFSVDSTAVQNVEKLVANTLTYVNTQMMAWGVLDLWPDASQPGPTNWKLLDAKLQFALATGAIPVITLCEAPWWMKGQLNGDGTTTLLTVTDEFAPIAYTSRILDNQMSAWLMLVQAVAKRYMIAPYSVRHFQVWNELKGYHNPATNDWDVSTSPGDPSGPNAKHGYTCMYNHVYGALKQAARELNIDPATVNVGGPYNVVGTWSSKQNSNPSPFQKTYGDYDQRDLNAIQYWLQNKIGAEFITVDGNNANRDKCNVTDPFTASEKFGDVVTWIRGLDPSQYPGSDTLPIWFAEWYALPYSNVSDAAYSAAIKTYSVIKFIKAGGSVVLEWTGGPDINGSPGLWTPIGPGGGQATPWQAACQAIKQYFPPGTQLLQTTLSSSSVEVLASGVKTIIVNKTNSPLNLQLNSAAFTLAPYQVMVIDTPVAQAKARSRGHV